MLVMNTKSIKPIILQFLNIASLVLVLVMNFAATSLPLNGISTEEISAALPSYFTPAGYTFAIWGLIYTALIAFAIYQARPSERKRPFSGEDRLAVYPEQRRQQRLDRRLALRLLSFVRGGHARTLIIVDCHLFAPEYRPS